MNQIFMRMRNILSISESISDQMKHTCAVMEYNWKLINNKNLCRVEVEGIV